MKENPDLLKNRGDKGENLLDLCCGIDIEKRGLSAADSIKTAGVLLDASLDINREAFTEGEWKATPLWYAVGRGKNLEVAKYLLKRGADPEHCLWAAALRRRHQRSTAAQKPYVDIARRCGPPVLRSRSRSGQCSTDDGRSGS